MISLLRRVYIIYTRTSRDAVLLSIISPPRWISRIGYHSYDLPKILVSSSSPLGLRIPYHTLYLTAALPRRRAFIDTSLRLNLLKPLRFAPYGHYGNISGKFNLRVIAAWSYIGRLARMIRATSSSSSCCRVVARPSRRDIHVHGAMHLVRSPARYPAFAERLVVRHAGNPVSKCH